MIPNRAQPVLLRVEFDEHLLQVFCNDDTGSCCATESVHAGILVRAMRRRFRGEKNTMAFGGGSMAYNDAFSLQGTCDNLHVRVLSRLLFYADKLWSLPIAVISDFCFLDFVH